MHLSAKYTECTVWVVTHKRSFYLKYVPPVLIRSRTSSHLAHNAMRSCRLYYVHHIQHINRLIFNWLGGDRQRHVLFVCWLRRCDVCMQTGNSTYAAFSKHARLSTVQRKETLRLEFRTGQSTSHSSGFPATTFIRCRPDAMWRLLAECQST